VVIDVVTRQRRRLATAHCDSRHPGTVGTVTNNGNGTVTSIQTSTSLH